MTAGHTCWHGRVNVTRHDLHIGNDVRSVLLPAAPDVAVYCWEIFAGVSCGAMRRDRVGLPGDGRPLMIAERDSVILVILGVDRRDGRVFGDVVQGLVPAVEHPVFLCRGRSRRRFDQAVPHRIKNRAAALTGLYDQRGAVVVLEGDGVFREGLAIGEGHGRDLCTDIVVLRHADAGEVNLAGQHAVGDVIPIIVDAVGIVEPDQSIIGHEAYRPVDFQKPDAGDIHSPAGNCVGVDQRAILDHERGQGRHALHAECLELAQAAHIQRGDAVDLHIPQPTVLCKGDTGHAGALGIESLQIDVR